MEGDMMTVIRHGLDKLLTKLVSRKLMVWLTATALMLSERTPLDSSDWVAISLAYIGLEGLADIATRWRHGK
tara:strand:- start:420 stop:635 length:216 start_codon:yes stop_codon:yes gene_type:complete